jgi:hypothetical protein
MVRHKTKIALLEEIMGWISYAFTKKMAVTHILPTDKYRDLIKG